MPQIKGANPDAFIRAIRGIRGQFSRPDLGELSASQTAAPMRVALRARRTQSADSPKTTRETATARGILALLSAARVPAVTRVAPRFQRKKPRPEDVIDLDSD